MKDCILIATLPSFNDMDKVQRVFESHSISEVRFNTGVQTSTMPRENVELLNEFSKKYGKKVWIDLKGRQLRVAKWADPLYSCIELNHKVDISYPAIIHFRNGDTVNITHVKDGNKLFVSPLPREALGAGQSVNIIADKVDVDGYLTPQDIRYLRACREYGIKNIMASFVEDYNDISNIRFWMPKAEIVSKIESLKGIELISYCKPGNLMAARDDLFLQTGQGYSMLKYLKRIIEVDPEAICASKIFSSLERRLQVDFADFADLELMYSIGYRKFMLCDNVCNYCFEQATKAWEEFKDG